MANVVKISSLKVTLDDGQYEQKARAIVAVNEQMARSADPLVRQLGAVDQAAQRGSASLERIRRAADPAYAAATRLANSAGVLRAQVAAGNITLDDAARLFDQLKAKQDASTVSAREAAEAQRVLQKTIADARAAQGAAGAQHGYNSLLGIRSGGGGSAAASAAVFQEEFERVEQQRVAMERLAADAQLVRDKIDPIAAVERRFGDEVARVNGLVAQGALSEREGTAAVALAATAREKEILRLEEASNAHAGLFGWLGKNRMAAMEMEHSARAMADGLAAGISPVRLLSMEGPRLAQALSVAGLSMRSLLMIGGGAAAIIAVAVALGEMATEAEHTARAVGEIQAAFDSTGRGGFSTEAIDQLILRYRELPRVSTQAAEASITSMARQRDIGVQSYDRLMAAAVGFARASGRDVPQAMTELTSALGGGIEGLERLDQQYDFLTGAQLEEIERLELSGHRTEAYAAAIDALNARFGRLKGDGMTAGEKGAEELRLAWEDLTGQVGNEGPWSRAIGFMEHLGAVAVRNARDVAAAGIFWQVALGAHALLDQPRAPGGGDGAPAPASLGNDAGGATSEHGIQSVLDQGHQVKEVLEDTKAFASARRDINKLLAQQQGLEEAIATTAKTQPALAAELESRLQKVDVALAKAQYGPSRMADWQVDLDNQLLHQKAFGDARIQIELNYWEQHKALAAGSIEDEKTIDGEILRLRTEMATKGMEAAKKASDEQFRAQEEQANALPRGSDAQIAAYQHLRDVAVASFGVISTQATEMAGKVAEAQRAASDEAGRAATAWGQIQLQLAKTSTDAQIQGLDAEVDAHRITAAQKFAIEQQLYTQIWGLERQGLQNEMANDALSASEKMRLYGEIVEGDQRLQLQLAEVNRQAADEQKRLNDEMAKSASETWSKIGDAATRALDVLETHYQNGTERAKAFLDVAKDLAKQLTQKYVMDPFLEDLGLKQKPVGGAGQAPDFLHDIFGGGSGSGGSGGGSGSDGMFTGLAKWLGNLFGDSSTADPAAVQAFNSAFEDGTTGTSVSQSDIMAAGGMPDFHFGADGSVTGGMQYGGSSALGGASGLAGIVKGALGGGSQSVATMTVTAGSVTVNGGTGGLPGGAGGLGNLFGGGGDQPSSVLPGGDLGGVLGPDGWFNPSADDIANTGAFNIPSFGIAGDTGAAAGGSGLFGNLFSWLGGLLAFDDGGSPPVGVPSLVGESGPELFVPRTAGSIVPNGQFGGSSSYFGGDNHYHAHFHGDVGGDPAQVHKAVTEAMQKAGPIWMKQTHDRAVNTVYSSMNRGGTVSKISGRRPLGG